MAKRILNSAVTRNVLVAAVTGGEPLLNKSVFEIIHEIKKRKIQCMLFTNGMLLKKYMSRLLDNGLDEINLSLYDHTLDQLKGVLPDLCKKFPYINITYVLLRSVLEKNPEQVREVISTCQESGCNSLRFNLCRPTNGDLSEVIDSYCNAYRDFVAESRARYKDLKIVFPEPAYSEIKGKQDKKCRIPWQLLYMDPDGRFGMCCANVQILEPCGNIFADSDIRSYNAPTLVEIREKLLAKDSVIPECCEKCGSMNGCINLL